MQFIILNILLIISIITPCYAQSLRPLIKNTHIGIAVWDFKKNKSLYQRNADHYFTPASNMKLFTAWTAVQVLGPNYVYQTKLFADLTKLQNGILNTDVYLQFSGDPTLTYSQLQNLLNTLTQHGIQKIKGRIIIDDQAFDEEYYPLGSSADDQIYCYGSPIDAILINHNCVNATLSAAAQEGQLAVLTLPMDPQFIQFVNEAKTQNLPEEKCKLTVTNENNKTYKIGGCLPITKQNVKLEMAIHNPRENIKAILEQILQQRNIQLSDIEFNKINLTTPLIATEQSAPLFNLIKIMLKESDNTIADALFKTLGAVYKNEQGSWENGAEAMHDVLIKTANIDLAITLLRDGAGGSRYTFITPNQIIQLLKIINQSIYKSIFMTSLPISGVDGTIKTRMIEPDIRGKVFAKTGSMTAVSSLSGFMFTQKNHFIAFSIMINNFIDKSQKYRDLEDKITREIIKTG